MLDQAFSPEQLENQQIQALRADVEATESRERLEELYSKLHEKIAAENTVYTLLRESHEFDTDAMEKIYKHYNRKLKIFKAKVRTETTWNRLVDEIREVAERLWRDDFLILESNETMSADMRNHESDNFLALQKKCQISKLLLVLWLEAQLYEYRADANRRALQFQPNQSAGATTKAIREAIQKRIANYKKALGAWNDELRKRTGEPLFIQRYADAQRFQTIGKEFISFSGDDEAGWAAQSDAAYDEVRYQLFEEQRKGSPFPLAVLYYMLRVTTGYGMRPLRFLWTGIGAVLTFTLAFFLNDFFNPGIRAAKHFCPEDSVRHLAWYDFPFRYLYIAVTNLSGLGSNSDAARYCGGTVTQVLLVCSAVTGYFLLAVLAALVFKLLTEAV